MAARRGGRLPLDMVAPALTILALLVVHATVPPAAAQTPPGTVFRDCPHCPEMVAVPAGSFLMGSPPSGDWRFESEEPQRVVTVRADFAIGIYEVTFEEWDACVSDGGCRGHRPSNEGWGRGRRPVTNVSWEDATHYVQWLSEETGQTYRLPSEAQWEYAARSGTETARYWGESDSEQCRYANGFDQDCAEINERRAEMFQDMGYASETLRSAYRFSLELDHRDNGLGFRVIRVVHMIGPGVPRH